MRFSELLIKEHEPIRRALNVLERMAQDTEIGVSVDRHDVNALLIFLHYFADVCHQAKEESILFPLLKTSSTSGRLEEGIRKQLEELFKEHGRERSLIEETQLALFSEKPSEFIENARKLDRILSAHSLKEEKVLFPLAERVLSQREADEALMRIEEADATFGCSQRKLLIELLGELERKYVQKAA